MPVDTPALPQKDDPELCRWFCCSGTIHLITYQGDVRRGNSVTNVARHIFYHLSSG
jgi:hypothetical protein